MQNSPAVGELSLREHLGVLRRRKVTIAATMLFVVLAAVAFSAVQKASYEATAEVLLQPRASEQIYAPSQQAPVDQSQIEVDTEIQVMKSRSVQDAVTRELGRVTTVDIEARNRTMVVALTAHSNDPGDAAHIANTYASTYVRVRRQATIDDLVAASTQIQQQIDKATADIAALDRAVAALDAQIVAAGSAAERTALKDQRDQLVASNAKDLLALQTRRSGYTDQLDKLTLASNLTQTGGAQIVSEAQVPSSPVSPQPIRDAFLALFVGLLIGIGIAFLREHLDDTIKTKDDLDGLPAGFGVLSLIPVVDGWKDRAVPTVVSVTAPQSAAAESYRALRTAIQFLALDHPMGIVQVTSPQAAEGKTTTLSNLAVALARSGKRVIVVDCDLRKPRVESFFNVSNEVGFTTVLLGETPLSAALHRLSDQPRLVILPAGPPPPNPSELLSTKRAGDMLARLRTEADYVLVDSPPVLPVADAIILAGFVDATLLVVTAGSTTKRQAQRAAELLQQVHAPMIGTVLNAVGVGDGYDSGFDYRYGYGYGQGQGQHSARRRWFRRRQSVAGGAQNGAAPNGRDPIGPDAETLPRVGR